MPNPRTVMLPPALMVLTLFIHTNDVQASEALMEKSGCLSCHRVDQKLIGPTFKEVAARYRNRSEVVSVLLQKVREGGEGEWGDIPMAANSPEKISDANLKAVIEWILSL